VQVVVRESERKPGTLVSCKKLPKHDYNLGARDDAGDTGQFYDLLTSQTNSILNGEVLEF
jgi:hypothetical protein